MPSNLDRSRREDWPPRSPYDRGERARSAVVGVGAELLQSAVIALARDRWTPWMGVPISDEGDVAGGGLPRFVEALPMTVPRNSYAEGSATAGWGCRMGYVDALPVGTPVSEQPSSDFPGADR